jgi:hypothetical protein
MLEPILILLKDRSQFFFKAESLSSGKDADDALACVWVGIFIDIAASSNSSNSVSSSEQIGSDDCLLGVICSCRILQGTAVSSASSISTDTGFSVFALFSSLCLSEMLLGSYILHILHLFQMKLEQITR